MKRLMLCSTIFMFVMIYAEDAVQPVQNFSVDQSPSSLPVASGDISVDVANLHHIDLDNTEIDSGGNWLNKRIWYQRSQVVFGEIRALISDIGDIRVQFSNEINAIGQKIDSFFETINFTKVQLDEKLHEMLTALETEQKIVGDLSEEERNLQNLIKEALPSIEQIGKDIKSIGEIDNKIDQTMMQALKTIDECRALESKAWDLFRDITHELDDKKVRNFYYQMNNYKQNIEQKGHYLKSTLLPYLHNVLVARVDVNIAKINSAMGALTIKGLDLEKIMSKTQEDDALQIKEREKIVADIAVKKALQDAHIKEQEALDTLKKELEEAKKNSLSNLVQVYYAASLGKVINFFSQFVDMSNILYVFAPMRAYMHNLVEQIMAYFGNQVAKVKDEKKIADVDKVVEQPIVPVTSTADEIQVEEKVVTPSSMQSDVNSPQVTISSSAMKNIEEHVEKALAGEIPLMSSAAPLLEQSKQDVVIQSVQHEEKGVEAGTAYHVFKNILDFIFVIFTSIYNCILQFFKMLFSFFIYLSSSN